MQTAVSILPAILLSATDIESNYLRYKIQLATDNAFTLNLQTFDQTVSSNGLERQNAQTGTAYNSGSTAIYTVPIRAHIGDNILYSCLCHRPGRIRPLVLNILNDILYRRHFRCAHKLFGERLIQLMAPPSSLGPMVQLLKIIITWKHP